MKKSHLIGVIAALMSYLAYSLGDAVRKIFSLSGYNPFYIMAWSSVIALVALAVFIALRGRVKDDLRVKRKFWMCCRMVSNIALGFCAITSFKLLPMTDAYILIMTAPAIGILAYTIFIKEQMRVYKAWALLFGFIGALMVIKPGLSEWNPAYVFAVMTAVVFVFNNGVSKHLVAHESKMALIFYPNIMNLVGGALALQGDVLIAPPVDEWWLFVLSALFSLLGAIGMVFALKYIEASEVSLYHYVQVFYGVVIGYLVFKEVPDMFAFGGMVAIFISGWIIYHGARRRRQMEFADIQP